MDDHDRRFDFNWRAAGDGTLLHWDSGLSWRHGPRGNASCLEILCGSTSWREGNQMNPQGLALTPDCQRICVFRRETIKKLRALRPISGSPSFSSRPTAGKLWKERLSQDPLFPVVHFGEFADEEEALLFPRRMRFVLEDFAEGINFRVEVLLDWVDTCVSTFGEANVLI